MLFAPFLQSFAWKKIVFSCAFVLSLFPGHTFAASLSLSPANGSYAVGSTLTVGVYVDSEGQALNAVSGTISFPSDKLEVASISKNQSIISLWVQEPSYSNVSGTINFEGIMLNPGYTGRSGKVATVTFRAKAEGSATLNFSTGSILANDGSGSEILSRKGTASFTVAPEVLREDTPVPSPDRETDRTTPIQEGGTALPVVQTVGVLQGGWSNQTTQNFSFEFGEQVSAIRMLLDDKPDSIPVVVYEPAITAKEITAIPEGYSYLHIQTKENGVWGEVVHHQIAIDTKAPTELEVTRIERPGTNGLPPVFVLKATDGHSGIERFEVLLDGGEPELFTGADSVTYIVPELATGEYTLRVRTFDKAGNGTEKMVTFLVTKPELENAEKPSQPLSNFIASATMLVTLLSIVVPLIALVVLLGIIVLYSNRHYRKYKDHVHTEVIEAKMVTKQVFTLIKTDLEADILILEKAQKKRALTKEESKLLKNIKQNIAGAEKVITEEVEDIL